MARVVYLNGKLVQERTAKISLLDRGFLLGEGVFETMRAYNGKAFALSRHLSRIARNAGKLGIPLPTAGQLRDAVNETVAANKLQDARIRLTVTAGPGGPGLIAAKEAEPTVSVIAHPLDPPDPRMYERGIRAITLPIRKCAASPLAGVKTTSYGDNLLGRRLARQAGVEEGIFLNTDGDVCEGTASNVFAIRFGELLTPDLGSGCLPGITRELVLEVAPAAGLRVREAATSPLDLAQAEEAFITASTRELVPLVEIDGDPIDNGSPGPKTSALHKAYRATVEADCGPVDAPLC